MKRSELVYEKTNGLAPFSYTVVDKWLYFCDQYIPGLFRYHFEKEVCECVAKINRNYIKSHFYKFYSYKDVLWMLPFFKEKIACYNLITQEMLYYDIPEKIEEETIPFGDMFFWKEKAYLVPRGNNRYLIKLDLLTHDMQEIQLLEKAFFNGAVQFQQRICMIESSKGQILLFNIDSNEKKIINLGKYKVVNFYARGIGEKIYFLPIIIRGDDNLLIYDINTECLIEEEYPIKNLPEGDVCIHVVFGKEIWVLANKQKKIYQINDNLEIMSEISILNFNEKKEKVYISGIEVSGHIFWNGYKGTPLIQVKNGITRMLDVSKEKKLFDGFIEMVKRDEDYVEKEDGFIIGQLIYKNID